MSNFQIFVIRQVQHGILNHFYNEFLTSDPWISRNPQNLIFWLISWISSLFNVCQTLLISNILNTQNTLFFLEKPNSGKSLLPNSNKPLIKYSLYKANPFNQRNTFLTYAMVFADRRVGCYFQWRIRQRTIYTIDSRAASGPQTKYYSYKKRVL